MAVVSFIPVSSLYEYMYSSASPRRRLLLVVVLALIHVPRLGRALQPLTPLLALSCNALGISSPTHPNTPSTCMRACLVCRVP